MCHSLLTLFVSTTYRVWDRIQTCTGRQRRRLLPRLSHHCRGQWSRFCFPTHFIRMSMYMCKLWELSCSSETTTSNVLCNGSRLRYIQENVWWGIREFEYAVWTVLLWTSWGCWLSQHWNRRRWCSCRISIDDLGYNLCWWLATESWYSCMSVIYIKVE